MKLIILSLIVQIIFLLIVVSVSSQIIDNFEEVDEKNGKTFLNEAGTAHTKVDELTANASGEAVSGDVFESMDDATTMEDIDDEDEEKEKENEDHSQIEQHLEEKKYPPTPISSPPNSPLPPPPREQKTILIPTPPRPTIKQTPTTLTPNKSKSKKKNTQTHLTTPLPSSLTYLDILTLRTRHYLLHVLIPPTSTQCDWSWKNARCEPACICALDFMWGDYSIGRSCRLRVDMVDGDDDAVVDDGDDDQGYNSNDKENNKVNRESTPSTCDLPPKKPYTILLNSSYKAALRSLKRGSVLSKQLGVLVKEKSVIGLKKVEGKRVEVVKRVCSNDHSGLDRDSDGDSDGEVEGGVGKVKSFLRNVLCKDHEDELDRETAEDDEEDD